jgi:hypothetical protein
MASPCTGACLRLYWPLLGLENLLFERQEPPRLSTGAVHGIEVMRFNFLVAGSPEKVEYRREKVEEANPKDGVVR